MAVSLIVPGFTAPTPALPTLRCAGEEGAV